MSKVLVVQRGHCFRTTGATGTAGEQQLAIKVAAEIARQQPEGWDVRVINADEDESRYVGHGFVALHADGSDSASAHGASVGYRTSTGYAVAQRFKKAYVAVGWKGGFRPDNYTADERGYYGTGIANQVGNHAAVIIELGFLTNASDRAWLLQHPEAAAHAIWEAFAPGATPLRPRKVQVTRPMKARPRATRASIPVRGGTVTMNQVLSLVTRDANGWALVVLPNGRRAWLDPKNYKRLS